MTAEPRAPTWYCSRCARPVTAPQRAVDPDQVLGVCAWTDELNRPKGHGLVPVVRSQAIAWDLIRADRRRKATARHASHDPRHPHAECDRCYWTTLHRGHVANRRPNPECPLCQVATDRARPPSIGTRTAEMFPAVDAPEGGSK